MGLENIRVHSHCDTDVLPVSNPSLLALWVPPLHKVAGQQTFLSSFLGLELREMAVSHQESFGALTQSPLDHLTQNGLSLLFPTV